LHYNINLAQEHAMNDADEPITYTVDNDANVHGTSKKLTIKASYNKLVTLFGEPSRPFAEGEHARVEWVLSFSDGYVATIYDWNEEIPVEEVTSWNVAGTTFMSAGRVHDILAGKPIIA
jgi:hypothetical protein